MDTPSNTIPTEPATPTPSEPAAPPPPASPPAATIVVEGGKTEHEVELEKQLETERSARRRAETDAAYALDEARRLKEIQSRPPESARPKPKKSPRWTLLHEEED